jgi:hypothetical protein
MENEAKQQQNPVYKSFVNYLLRQETQVTQLYFITVFCFGGLVYTYANF